MMIGPAPMMRIEEISFRLGIPVTRACSTFGRRGEALARMTVEMEAEAPSYTGERPKKSTQRS
jgi:hypothetical protein